MTPYTRIIRQPNTRVTLICRPCRLVSVFAQDTWKPTAKLILTYGVRCEINPAALVSILKTSAALRPRRFTAEQANPRGRPAIYCKRLKVRWKLAACVMHRRGQRRGRQDRQNTYESTERRRY